MENIKNKKPEPSKHVEEEGNEVNWPVVLPILIIMAIAILYIFLF